MPDKIYYDGDEFDPNVEGEDEKYAGGIWDLAGAIANNFVTTIRLRIEEAVEDVADQLYDNLQSELYNIIKYDVLGLENESTDDNEM